MHRFRTTVPALLAAITTITALTALPACEDKPAPPAVTPAPTAPTGTSPVPADNAASGTPRITFASATHDFGTVIDSEKYRTSFSFTNTGTGKLVIYDVKTSCGCTVATLRKNEFLPGEGSTIDVVFDPSGKTGNQAKDLSVVSNAGPSNVTKLSIRAFVQPLVQYRLFLPFGELALGQPHTRRVVLFYQDPNLQITDLFVTNPTVSARVVDAGRPNPVSGQPPYLATIEVAIGPNTPWGLLFQTRVKFTARGEPAQGLDPVAMPYTIFVNGQIFGDHRVDPAMLTPKASLGRGEPVRISTTLSRASGAPFSVHDVTITNSTTSGMSAHVESKSANTYEIVVEGVTPAAGGAVNGALMVRTDVPGEDRLVLQFSMYVR